MTATILALQPDQSPESWDEFIARIAGALSRFERQGDAASWAKAKTVVDGWKEAQTRPELHNLTDRQKSKRYNDSLRARWEATGDPSCRPSFMADARKLYSTWPEVVLVDQNILPYDDYRRMAVSGLPDDQKDELKTWAEKTRPKQAVLRQEIRDRGDALDGVYRPDFELKTSNHWVFQVTDEKRVDGFEGGVNTALYANLIHSFSDPGGTILDPFAGGGLLRITLDKYRHFREVTKAEHSGPRRSLMCDIDPKAADIVRADSRAAIPFDTDCVDLAIIDPPYFAMSEGKYDGLGKTIETWVDGLRSVLREVARCLKPKGIVAIMTDDFVRKRFHGPMGFWAFSLLHEEGWEPVATIYNFNRNSNTSMDGAEMSRAKAARLHVNAVKIIQVASCSTVTSPAGS